MDDDTVYGSPASATPYLTPLSTPNRLPTTYRMNPVRLVRQHVPLKIQSCKSSTSSVDLENGAVICTGLTINPMQIKKNKCVIQPFLSAFKEDREVDVHNVEHNDSYQRTQCSPTEGDAIGIHRPNITFNSVANAGGDNKSKIPVPFTNLSSTDGGSVACSNSSAISRKESQLKESSIPDVMKSLIRVEKEVQSIDQYLKCNLETNQDKNMSVTKEAQTISSNTNEVQGKVKEDTKRYKLTRKTVNPKTSQDNPHVLHECDKKKYYDPQDIRKYIRKKRDERKAKEMQEKCRKATEQAVIKRKADEAKFCSNRLKFSTHKSSEQIYEPSKVKNLNNCKDGGKSLSKDMVQATKKRVVNAPLLSKSENSARVNVGQSSSPKTRMPSYREHSKIHRTENHSTDQPMSTFHPQYSAIQDSQVASDSNQINEVGVKVINAKESVSELPSELDILKFENPYKFPNILKGKMNLAQMMNDADLSTPVKQIMSKKYPDSRSHITDNSIKKHQKWGNFHVNTITHTSLPLQHELTLSDLNVSSEEGSDPTICDANIEIDKIFNINKELDGAHKLDLKNNGKKELKENKNTLEMSGIRLLSSSRGIAPLSENNFITNKIESGRTPSLRFEDNLFQSSNEIRSDECIRDVKHVSRRSSVGTNKSYPILTKFTSSASLKESNLPLNSELAENTEKTLTDTLNDYTNLSPTTLWIDLYDQMLNNEDEKFAHIIQKIHQQKESLNKHLKSEILALEQQKIQYRESREEEKIRVMKKRQRAVLVRVTKNILELEKMKKTITDTVGERKSELLKRKLALQEAKNAIPKAKKSVDAESKAYLISNRTETVLGISSSSCTSIILEGDIERNLHVNDPRDIAIITDDQSKLKICNVNLEGEGKTSRKDRATSPVRFNPGISIRLDLDPDKIAHKKHDCAQVIIEAKPSVFSIQSLLCTESSHRKLKKSNPDEDKTTREILAPEPSAKDMASNKTSIRIKRPLSPMVFSPSKKISHLRYHSSSSDVTLPSLNCDTTTTDQSDIELRISALQEQLRKRKLEAERLRKEEKKIRKEKLRTKEQSLMKQLDAYEQYIKRISQMLIEESSKITPSISKPLIKPTPSRKQRWDITREKIGASTSTFDDMSVDSQIVCEGNAETDTEDSEKQLRKADSGILVESEVTEVSEAVESRCQEIVGVEEANSVLSEISHSAKKSSMEEDGADDGSLKMPNKFLQLVSDLQDEVFSLSEQLYTPDFVEDAAETKSENNTSMSIEEILSDYRSESGEVVKCAENMTNIVQSIVTTNSENLSTVVESLEKEKNELINDEVSSPQMSENVESGKGPGSIDEANSDLDSAAGFLNIKNISDIKSWELEVETNMVRTDDSGEVEELKCIYDQVEGDCAEGIQKETKVNDGDVTELSSIEFLKVVNRFDDIEDSYVADTHYLIPDDNGVKTLVEKLSLSEPSDLTLTHSKPVLQEVISSVSNNVASDVINEDRFVISPQQNFIIENGAEETDISESLEYDVSMEPTQDDSLGVLISSVKTESPKSVPIEGTSREQNRSMEELLEDRIVPNIFGATFIVNDMMCDVNVDISDFNHSAHTPSLPGPLLSTVVGEESETKEVLDARITEDQTPFLQALKRERDNLIAKNLESKNHDTNDMVDTLVDTTYSDLLRTLFLNASGDEPKSFQTAEWKSNELDNVFQMRAENSNFIDEYVDKLNENKTEEDSSQSRLREAEQLRLQQMKIEQEIEALQAQQSVPPYIYLREIPNKPPPPYIPPIRQQVYIPDSESELHQVASSIIEYVCEQLEKNVDPIDITQVSELIEDKAGCDSSAYKRILFDLAKEVACDILEQTKEKRGERLPWEEMNRTVSMKPKPRGEQLRSLIQARIGEYFGFRSRINKEKLIIRWSRKKKMDYVDDLLIQELQEEESEWTKYDEDELIIKNRITDNLLDELIKDTVVSLQDAFQIKEKSLQIVI